METTARDEAPEPLRLAPNVQERAQRFEEELATSPGEVVLQRMLAELDDWFRDTVRVVASRYHLEYDDVYQEAALRLYTSRHIDPDHEHLLAYVRKAIGSAARDLLARRQRAPEVGRDEDIATRAWRDVNVNGLTSSDSDDVPYIHDEWLADVLTRAGLSRRQHAVLYRIFRHGDLPLTEVAAISQRSYAATRQDKRRALAGLRARLGLTTVEFNVYSGWHQGLSLGQIAMEYGLPATTVKDLLTAAQHKIMQFLYPERRESIADG
jgi:DNA-directed RNA polymerase specialized sigma24 family protein